MYFGAVRAVRCLVTPFVIMMASVPEFR